MNKNLAQLAGQLAAIWKQLGLNQRISVVLGTLIVLVGLISLVIWSNRGDYTLLYGKLDDAEAARVVSALDDMKVPYQISRGGGAIQVPSGKVHYLRMQLAARGIPRGDGVGFEIFDKANFGISDFVQRANYLRAVQGELARTISQLDEIEAARVMIVMPENRLLVDKNKHATASVFVKTRGQTQLPVSSVNSIRFLVANSVEGLQAQHVSVVDNMGNVLSENSENESISGLTSTQLAARRNVEQYLGKKAEGMLEKVLGPGQAVVRVAAEINFDSVSRVEEKFDPDGQVIRSSQITDDNTDTTTSGAGGGAPGIAANVGSDTNAAASAGAAANNTHTKKKVTNNDYEINKITSNVMQAAGGLKRVTVAVFVAANFEGTGKDRKMITRPPQEMDKIKRIVQSALGIDPLRKDEIALEEMPFNDTFATEFTQQLNKDQKSQFWFGLIKNLGYPLLALAAIFLFVRAVKRTPADSLPIGQGGAGRAEGKGDFSWDQAPAPVVTVDVLNQLIRENPDNMTQALRTWMNRNTPVQK